MDSGVKLRSRNHGIDLLKIITSITVVLLHLLHYGGIEAKSSLSLPMYYVFWFLGVAIMGSVNCFALISGFVAYDADFKLTRLLRLQLTAVFHGLIITLLMSRIFPHSTSSSDLLKAFFPVMHDTFWYYSSYFGLFFFMPLLAKGMQAASRKQADVVIAFLVVCFSIIPTFTGRDMFELHRGYSVLWLAALFAMGAYIRKYRESLCRSKAKLFIAYLALTVASFVMKLLSAKWNMPFLEGAIEYCSPTVLFASAAVVRLFSEIRPSPKMIKVISFLVPFTFAVYLIHEHPLIRNFIIADSMLFVLELGWWIQLPVLLAFAIAVVLVCIILDYIKKCVFSFLKIDYWLLKLGTSQYMKDM